MTMIIAGAPAGVHTLAEGRETDANTAIWAWEPVDAADTAAGLAAALVAFEAEVSGRQIESIVLADASDAALAAALIGTKLPVDVYAVAAAREAPSANGRLIGQLAAAYTPPA
jgi:hypothetical protein